MPTLITIDPTRYAIKPETYLFDLASEFLGKHMATTCDERDETTHDFSFNDPANAKQFQEILDTCFPRREVE